MPIRFVYLVLHEKRLKAARGTHPLWLLVNFEQEPPEIPNGTSHLLIKSRVLSFLSHKHTKKTKANFFV